MQEKRKGEDLGQWVVHKFGGTSVQDAQRYLEVTQIMDQQGEPKKVIVVSAMSGVTNALIHLVQLAASRDESYIGKCSELKFKHLQTLDALIPSSFAQGVRKTLEIDFDEILEILRGIYLVGTESEKITELIAGYGEIWSARLLEALLSFQKKEVAWLDARKVLIVRPYESHVAIEWETSKKLFNHWQSEHSQPWVVITGFIASTPHGVATTLKRNGSDFSATIFAHLLNAASVTIWKEVNGVLSADPKFVPEAKTLKEMSYQEATELAYFGAKVVHPATMTPVIERRIPIYIKNTFNPSFPGTKIHAFPEKSSQPAKGFSAIEKIAMINVEGNGMVGVPGVAHRLFGGLRDVGISVIMISQASSEHSICFAIPQSQSELAKTTIEQTFYAELHQGQIQAISVTSDCSILAAVGENMAHHPGVAGRLFGALGRAQINVRAIAQGSSEKNISIVIDQKDTRRALRAVHSAFFLSHQTLSIGVIGTGLIGKALLSQLDQEMDRLNSEFKIDLRIRGIANSKQMLLEENRVDLKNWNSQILQNGKDLNLSEFVDHINADYFPHSVLIDCTASQEIGKLYLEWLKRGIHIISPNKKANSDRLAFYREIHDFAKAHHRHFLYQTNVGGGLPILSTLRDLVKTGDRVLVIEGVLSGTLSYLLNHFDGRIPFSELVKQAQEKGYTEPDPRDDLSGKDVARKLVILAREIGISIELEEVQLESLVPYSDQKMAQLYQRAKAQNEVLRYVGRVYENGNATVGLKAYSIHHPFAKIQGSDNIVSFKTSRYHSEPLLIQGPGAGPEVTAGGVFADLLRLAAYVGGPQ